MRVCLPIVFSLTASARQRSSSAPIVLFPLTGDGAEILQLARQRDAPAEFLFDHREGALEQRHDA